MVFCRTFVVLFRSLKFLKDNGQVCICRQRCCPQNKALLSQRLLWLRWKQSLVFWAAFTLANMGKTAWEDRLLNRYHAPMTEGLKWPLLPGTLCCAAHNLCSSNPAGCTSLDFHNPQQTEMLLWGTGFPLAVCWFSLQMSCCKEVESNSADEACFHKFMDVTIANRSASVVFYHWSVKLVIVHCQQNLILIFQW